MNENLNEQAKTYELRELMADDMFPMFQILSKIGIKEFKHCFETDEAKGIIAQMSSGESKGKNDVVALGLSIGLDIASVLMSNIGKCKDDLYQLLASLSGKSTKEIARLPMKTFFEMIMDVVRKEEFADFFQAVSKLLK